MKRYFLLILVIISPFVKAQHENRTFVHPGILHSKESLDYIKEKIALKENPWYDTYNNYFRFGSYSSKKYLMFGGDEIATRDAGYNTETRNHKTALEGDAYAIYCQALMYKLTDDITYADNAVMILNDWAKKLERVVGADLELTVAFNAYFMVCGAELIMNYEGWAEEDQNNVKRMFREIWYPLIKNIERENGQGTWDSASAKCVMAIAVYLEDWEMFDSAYNYFFNGAGNGTIQNYFIESGQSQESGRRQGYAQLGLSNFEEWCEIAYHQGYPELWNAREDIIAASFEYHAKYNLGEDVPFTTIQGQYPGTTFTSISSDDRGSFKPIYFMAYNHFHNRRGLELPYTKRVIEEMQPIEKTHATITDGAGWGTLFFNTPGLIPVTIENSIVEKNEWTIFSEKERITIKGLTQQERIEIYNLSGCLMASISVPAFQESISLPKGIYMVKVDLSPVRKVIVY